MSKFWSGRLSGLPMALLEAMSAIIHRAADFLSTLLWSENLAACGKDTRILFRPVIRFPANIRLGKRVVIARNAELSAESSDGSLLVGDDTWIGEGSKIDFTGGVTIGEACTISPRVTIYSHSHGANPRSKPVGVPLKIGNSVWIGTGAIILQNVTVIPDKCLIGAGAIVKRNPDEGAVVSGNPARKIGPKP